MLTDEEREHECSMLTIRAVNFIMDELYGYKGTGLRRTQDLENDIWSWLWGHAIFEDDTHD